MQRLADVVEHDLRRLPVQAEIAAGRQEREAVLDLALECTAGRPGQGTQPEVEAELAALLADEVQDGAARLRRQAS
jgi:5-carboxymethyl-2-hydroxymuconate isomerase